MSYSLFILKFTHFITDALFYLIFYFCFAVDLPEILADSAGKFSLCLNLVTASPDFLITVIIDLKLARI